MARIWMPLCIVLLGAGCSADFPTPTTPTPTVVGAYIHYSSPHTAVGRNGGVFLRAYALDSEGVYQDVTSRAVWSSTDTSVASVRPGEARGVADGAAEVVATYQGVTASAPIIVRTTALPTGALYIDSFSVPQVGQTVAVQARLNTSVSPDVTTQGSWATSDPRVFTVNGGRLTATGPGTAVLSVTTNNVTASAYTSIMPIRELP